MWTESDEGYFGLAYYEISDSVALALSAYPNILVEISTVRKDNSERVWRREHFSTGLIVTLQKIVERDDRCIRDHKVREGRELPL